MPIKTAPVPTGEEAPSELPEEPKGEEEIPKPKKQSKKKIEDGEAKKPAPKRRAAQAAVKAAAKAQAKAQAALQKEEQALDMKQKVKCPICKRTISQHCLLYTHKCSKEALDKRPKMARVEEKFPEKGSARASAQLV